MSKSMAFHSVGAAYINDRSKNELAHILLTEGTCNKQGSNDARVRTVVHISFTLIKSNKYTGALDTVLCVKIKLLRIIMSWIFNHLSQNGGCGCSCCLVLYPLESFNLIVREVITNPVKKI